MTFIIVFSNHVLKCCLFKS